MFVKTKGKISQGILHWGRSACPQSICHLRMTAKSFSKWHLLGSLAPLCYHLHLSSPQVLGPPPASRDSCTSPTSKTNSLSLIPFHRGASHPCHITVAHRSHEASSAQPDLQGGQDEGQQPSPDPWLLGPDLAPVLKAPAFVG